MKLIRNSYVALVSGCALLVFGGAGLSASEGDRAIESSFLSSHTYRTHLREEAVHVASNDGLVSLTGQVSDPCHKYLAHETLAALPGVIKVDNRLEVTLAGGERSEAWIVSRARGLLVLHGLVNPGAEDVVIWRGAITLRGSVGSDEEKALATECVRDLDGVRVVVNLLTVARPAWRGGGSQVEAMDDASITAGVRVALQLHRSTRHVGPRVITQDGVVTIRGVAKSRSEKERVHALAAGVVGVRSVVNQMVLAPVAELAETPAPVGNLRIVTATD